MMIPTVTQMWDLPPRDRIVNTPLEETSVVWYFEIGPVDTYVMTQEVNGIALWQIHEMPEKEQATLDMVRFWACKPGVPTTSAAIVEAIQDAARWREENPDAAPEETPVEAADGPYAIRFNDPRRVIWQYVVIEQDCNVTYTTNYHDATTWPDREAAEASMKSIIKDDLPQGLKLEIIKLWV